MVVTDGSPALDHLVSHSRSLEEFSILIRTLVSASNQNRILQWATVRIIPQAECQEEFPGITNAFCTVGHDAVHQGPGIGDGGAPIVLLERGTYKQIGLYAFSWRNDFSRPSGYINLAQPQIRNFIRTVANV